MIERLSALLFIWRIKLLRIKPGDILVFTVPPHTGSVMADDLRILLERINMKNTAIWVEEGVKISTLNDRLLALAGLKKVKGAD